MKQVAKFGCVVAAMVALLGGAVAAQDADAPEAQVEVQSPLDRWLADPLLVLDGREVTIEDFHWRARPVVVFADSPFDPNFIEQMELLADRPEDLAARDVVVIVDTDPAARSALRLDLRPRGFQLALIAKDGTIMLRKPFPWDIREITHSIDKWPIRQQEIRDMNAGIR